MAERTWMMRRAAKRAQEEAPAETPKADTKSAEEVRAESDALLDEIDEVLTENAEEFVTAYVQKGGQ